MEQNLTPKLSKTQYHLVMYLEQAFYRQGLLPSYEAIKHNGISISEEEYNEAWLDPKFVNLLRSRGLPEHILTVKQDDPFHGHLLTEKQVQVANILMDTLDKRSRLKKLTELGVTTQTYNQWLKDPVYRSYCLERAEALLQENLPVAHMSLLDRVAQGDMVALKYYYAMTGRYREKSTAGVEVNVQNNYGSDTLISIVEIIQKHVKDPELLAAIGEDILALHGSSTTRAVGGRKEVTIGGSIPNEFKPTLPVSGYLET